MGNEGHRDTKKTVFKRNVG